MRPLQRWSLRPFLPALAALGEWEVRVVSRLKIKRSAEAEVIDRSFTRLSNRIAGPDARGAAKLPPRMTPTSRLPSWVKADESSGMCCHRLGFNRDTRIVTAMCPAEVD